ncbi:MAG: BadF/BadG/BcrA/BcrD ATPase family protein [Pirellulaceae bacterium]
MCWALMAAGPKRVSLATVDSNQDQQTPLAIGLAGPSNVRTVGLDHAIAELNLAISAAFQNADMERQTVDSICLALAGSDDVTTKQALQDWVRNQQIAKAVVVTNDAQAVMAAAFQDQPGMVVISGTGSLVLGQDGAGKFWRAGGWGPLFGDQGSGYWIALHLFRSLAEMLDQSQDPGVLGSLVANAANRRDLRSSAKRGQRIRSSCNCGICQDRDPHGRTGRFYLPNHCRFGWTSISKSSGVRCQSIFQRYGNPIRCGWFSPAEFCANPARNDLGIRASIGRCSDSETCR